MRSEEFEVRLGPGLLPGRLGLGGGDDELLVEIGRDGLAAAVLLAQNADHRPILPAQAILNLGPIEPLDEPGHLRRDE